MRGGFMRGLRAGVGVALGLLVALASTAAAHQHRHRHHRHHHKDAHVQVLAINDLHGNIQPPSGSSGPTQTGPDTSPTPPTPINTDAGGVEYLKTWVDKLRAERGHGKSFF